MKTRILLVVSLLTFLLSACGTPENPSDPFGYYPTRTPSVPSAEMTAATPENVGEARIRYIMADIQLSGLDSYYRNFPDDPEAAEAVRRWDQGIRVVNIDQFERKIVNETWQIVYVGTETTINGMDVILTEPNAATCSNPYWPIVLGATWTYDIIGFNGNLEGTRTLTISSIDNEASERAVYFNVTDGANTSYYWCSSDGRIYFEADDYSARNPFMILPAPHEMVENAQWTTDDSTSLMFLGFHNVQVPAGNFNAAVFVTLPNATSSESYAEGVGLVRKDSDGSWILRSYNIP